MNQFSAYIFLVLAVIFGIASNSSLKMTEGFTKLVPSIYCSVLIVLCILCLAKAMMTIPVGFTYATYGGLTITAVTIFGSPSFIVNNEIFWGDDRMEDAITWSKKNG